MKIVRLEETIDNWGRTETTNLPSEIAEILRDPETWTDDQIFYDEENRPFFIDDLIGKEVELEGIGTLKIEE
jgi:hypothetical protein